MVGSGERGDLAIDDVDYTPGLCSFGKDNIQIILSDFKGDLICTPVTISQSCVTS